MKHKSYLLLPLLLTGTLFAAGRASQSTDIRVGKTDSITFLRETHVGPLLLKPGDYTIRHRVIGNDHYVVFQRYAIDPDGAVSVQIGKAQRVECRMEPLATKLANTMIFLTSEGNIDRLKKIEVAGENVDHLF